MAVQADMPFNGLTGFGGAFLSKFQCSQMPHPVSCYTSLFMYANDYASFYNYI